jgi:hypothetical protein
MRTFSWKRLNVRRLGKMTLLIFALVSGFVVPATAGASGDNHSLICIHNKTHSTINYSYNWGSGNMTNMSVKPGETIAHFWRFDYMDQDMTPQLKVSFNSNMKSKKTYWMYYDLNTYASPNTDCSRNGMDYTFHYNGDNGNYIDLKG